MLTLSIQAQTIDLLSTAGNDSATIALQQDVNKMGGHTFLTSTQWGKPSEHMPLPLLYYGVRAGVRSGEGSQAEHISGVEVGATFWQLTHYQSNRRWFFHCGWNAGISADLVYQHITMQLQWTQTSEHGYSGREVGLPQDEQFYAFGYELNFRTGFPLGWSRYTKQNGIWTLGLEPELMLVVCDDRRISAGYDPHPINDFGNYVLVAPNLMLSPFVQYRRGNWTVGAKFDLIDVLSIMRGEASITGRLFMSYKF